MTYLNRFSSYLPPIRLFDGGSNEVDPIRWTVFGDEFLFGALRKKLTGLPVYAAFSKATNSVLLAAKRCAFSSR